MKFLWIALGILLFLALVVLLLAYGCFRMAFCTTKKKTTEEFPLPEGKVYEPHWDQMITWMKEIRAMPHEDVSVQSFDGLTLRGRYYEFAPGAPIELMFHGYRGSAERDLCGGIQRCFALQRSALVVEQRGSLGSDGHVISFGVNESRDCHTWLEFMRERFGPEVKIMLTGISMGASTVLMAAARPLPPNVVGVLADCGFTSAKEIICHVIRGMKLPPRFAYFFVRLGAQLYGRFDPEEQPAIQAVEHIRVPVIFFHGQTDDYVPCEMSVRNFEACTAPKRLVLIPGAGHGLSYMVEPERYLQEMEDFFRPYL